MFIAPASLLTTATFLLMTFLIREYVQFPASWAASYCYDPCKSKAKIKANSYKVTFSCSENMENQEGNWTLLLSAISLDKIYTRIESGSISAAVKTCGIFYFGALSVACDGCVQMEAGITISCNTRGATLTLLAEPIYPCMRGEGKETDEIAYFCYLSMRDSSPYTKAQD